jgi:hypothetical protein
MDKEKFVSAGLAAKLEMYANESCGGDVEKTLREAAAALRGERGDGLIAGDDTADMNGWIDRREGEFTKPLYTRPLSGEQAVRDAARYRWLRDGLVGKDELHAQAVHEIYLDSDEMSAAQFDAAIDAARKK